MSRGGARPNSGAKKGSKYRPRGMRIPSAYHCAFCGKEMANGIKKYCSPQCKTQATKSRRGVTPIERQCKHCGKRWIDTREKQGPKKYCSRECMIAAQPKRIKKKVVCQHCGKAFLTQNRSKYCSLKCSGAVLSKARRALRPVHICKRCGKQFTRVGHSIDSKIYCSRKCAGIGKMGSAKVKSDRRVGSHYRRAKYFGVPYETVIPVEVFKRDNWQCQICGKFTPEKNRGTRYPNAPELDHRVPMSIGGGHLYSNVQCACRRCNMAKSNRGCTGQFPLFQASAA